MQDRPSSCRIGTPIDAVSCEIVYPNGVSLKLSGSIDLLIISIFFCHVLIYNTSDGKNYNVTFYSLEMIMAIGFRVRGVRSTQFWHWANRNLTEDEIDTLNRLVVIFLEIAEPTV